MAFRVGGTANAAQAVRGQSMMEKMQEARAHMMNVLPFFSILVMKLKMLEVGWLKTAATDGEHLYFSQELNELCPTVEDRIFVMAHEVLHCAFDHVSRGGRRDPKLWNYAIDYVTNDILNQTVIQTSSGGRPLFDPGRYPHFLFEQKYRGMNAEAVYDDLVKNWEKIKHKIAEPDFPLPVQQSQQGQGCGNQQPQGGKGAPGKKKKGSQPGGKGAGAPGGGGQQQQHILDYHLDPRWKIDPKTGQRLDQAGPGGGKGEVRELTPEEIEAAKQRSKEWEDLLVDAINAENRRKEELGEGGQGTLPGQFATYIKEIRTPKTSLPLMLSQFVSKTLSNEANWSRFNKRQLLRGRYWPGHISDVIDGGVVVLDTSGSVSDEDAGHFLGILEEILVKLPLKSLRYMEVDTAVAKDVTVKKSINDRGGLAVVFPKKDGIPQVAIHGRGGTSFKLPFEKITKEPKRPKFLVYLTDGYGDFPAKKPPYPVFWVINNRDPQVKPPFGVVERFDKNDILDRQAEQERMNHRFSSAPGM